MKINARFAVMAASVAVLMAAAPIAQAVTSPGDIHPLVQAAHSPDGIPGNGVGPEFHTSSMARSYSEKHLGVAPRGVNDFSCKVKPGDRPVILIPGTGGNAFATWSFYGPHLAHEGYCVYTFTTNVPVGILDEGWGFTGDVRASAQALGAFVDRVRKATGSEKVDFVGHSQGGGILPNAYIKMYGGASKVDKLIGLVAANHGTTAVGLAKLVDGLPEAVKDFLSTWSYDHNMEAYGQQLKGSALMQQVYRDGDTVPGIAYTVISTRLDTTVTPYTQAFLKGAKNMTVQDACPLDAYGHGRLPYDPVAYQMVLNALDPNHPREISCTWRPRVLPVSTTDAA